MARGPAPFTATIRLEGAQETLRAFRELPKEASEELRKAALKLSESLAGKVTAAGLAQGRQAALVAGTVKAKRDRVPNITIGGSTRLGRHGTPAADLLFGSEFGAKRDESRKFSPYGYLEHTGKQGSWIFPTIEANEAEISREWNAAADRIIADFTAGDF